MKSYLRNGFFLVLFFFAVALHATMVLQLNLEQLTGLSEKIFVGKCLSVTKEIDSSGRPVQAVTFEVLDMIKGLSSKKITFNQLVGVDHSFTSELPSYHVGEEAIIFLSEESRLGLTAPVGLYQGKFQVEERGDGKKVVKNGADNRGLFIDPGHGSRLSSLTLTPQEKSVIQSRKGDLPYEDFISLIKKLVMP